MAFGDYKKAEELMDIYLNRNIPRVLRERINYERHRLERLKRSYPYSTAEALKLAEKKIKDFTAAELEEMRDERYTDWIFINGEVRYHRLFLDNILKIHQGMKDRILVDKKDKQDSKDDVLDKIIDEIIEKGEKGYYIRLRVSLKLKEEAVRQGKKLRVHLPIPTEARQISNIKILDSSPEATFISPEDYPQRTIYFEKVVEGEETFTVEFSYENRIKYQNPDPAKVLVEQPSFYTGEWAPHIVFTPFLTGLAEEIVGDEDNPLEKARLIYNYITENVQYSFMREYAGFTNIPEYAAYNLKGDCGVQALLFITLCRIAGIPARWQSGMYVHPERVGNHDWAEFYVAPYGWLFADASFGGSGYRWGDERKQRFYFGNLDPFRMVANSVFQYPLLPEKKFFRNDPYDNQSGEAEYQDKGLYLPDFESIREIVEMKEI